MPPPLEAAAAASHAEALAGLRAAQAASGEHAAGRQACCEALHAVGAQVVRDAPPLRGLHANLRDFVDLWAVQPDGEPVAAIVRTPLHTQPLSAGELQGWMAAVVAALRSAVRTVVVPVDAPPPAVAAAVREQLFQ